MKRGESLNRKSQVTIFIIVGIMLLLGVGLFISTRSSIEGVIEEDELSKEIEQQTLVNLESLNNYVESCIQKEAPLPIKLMAYQGGTLSLSDYRLYDEIKYRYLCIPHLGYKYCTPILLNRQDMEKELSEYLKLRLGRCIDLSIYKDQGYKVKQGDLDVDVDIATTDVVIKLNYPITITTSDQKKIEIDEFFKRIDLPLGKLYDMAVHIINEEVKNGFFEQDGWMTRYGAHVTIEKHKPYPDITYRLNRTNPKTGEQLIFNFGIEGKETIKEVGLPSIELLKGGCCYNNYDNTCYANVAEGACVKPDSVFTASDNNCTCPGYTLLGDALCEGEACEDCQNTWDYNTQSNTAPSRKHGESWCVYDGPVGNGHHPRLYS